MPDRSDEFDEVVDALDRYERTVDAQLSIISDIDDKAANVVRYTPLVVGVVFTALSLASRSAILSLTDIGLLPRIAFLSGLTGFAVAICAATVTYTSSVRNYGPNAEYGYNVADGDVISPGYEVTLLSNYADAVDDNRDVIDVNARRFRWALMGLLVGVVYTSLAGALVLLDGDTWLVSSVTIAVTVATGYATHRIYAEAFLVLDRGVNDNE